MNRPFSVCFVLITVVAVVVNAQWTSGDVTIASCVTDPLAATLYIGERVTLRCDVTGTGASGFSVPSQPYFFVEKTTTTTCPSTAPTVYFTAGDYNASTRVLTLLSVLSSQAVTRATPYWLCFYSTSSNAYRTLPLTYLSGADFTPQDPPLVVTVTTFYPPVLQQYLDTVYVKLSAGRSANRLSLVPCPSCSDAVQATLRCGDNTIDSATTLSMLIFSDASTLSGKMSSRFAAGKYVVCYGIENPSVRNVFSWSVITPSFVTVTSASPQQYVAQSPPYRYSYLVLGFTGSALSSTDRFKIVDVGTSCTSTNSDVTVVAATTVESSASTTQSTSRFFVTPKLASAGLVCYQKASWTSAAPTGGSLWARIYNSTTVSAAAVSTYASGDLYFMETNPRLLSYSPSDAVMGENVTLTMVGNNLLATDGVRGFLRTTTTGCDAEPTACAATTESVDCMDFTLNAAATQATCKLLYPLRTPVETALCLCYIRVPTTSGDVSFRLRSAVTIYPPNPSSVALGTTTGRPGRATALVFTTTDVNTIARGEVVAIDPASTCSVASPVGLTTVTIIGTSSTTWMVNSEPNQCFKVCFRVPETTTPTRFVWVPSTGSTATTCQAQGNLYIGAARDPGEFAYTPVRQRQVASFLLNFIGQTTDTVKLVVYRPNCLFRFCLDGASAFSALCDLSGDVSTLTILDGKSRSQADVYVKSSDTTTQFVMCYKTASDTSYEPLPRLTSPSTEADYVYTAEEALPATMLIIPTASPPRVHANQVSINVTLPITPEQDDSARQSICPTGAVDFKCGAETVAPTGTTQPGPNFQFITNMVTQTSGTTLCICFYRDSIPHFVQSIAVSPSQPANVQLQSGGPNEQLYMTFVTQPGRDDLRSASDSVRILQETSSYCLCDVDTSTSTQCVTMPFMSGFTLRQFGANTRLIFPYNAPLSAQRTYIACYTWSDPRMSKPVALRLEIPKMDSLIVNFVEPSAAPLAQELFNVTLRSTKYGNMSNASCVALPFATGSCAAVTAATAQTLNAQQRLGEIVTTSAASPFITKVPFVLSQGEYLLCCQFWASQPTYVEVHRYVNDSYYDRKPIVVAASPLSGFTTLPAAPSEGQEITVIPTCSGSSTAPCTCSSAPNLWIVPGSGQSCWNTALTRQEAVTCSKNGFTFRGLKEVMEGSYTVCLKYSSGSASRILQVLSIAARNPQRFTIQHGQYIAGSQETTTTFTITGTALNPNTDKIDVVPYDMSCHDTPLYDASTTSLWRALRGTLDLTGSSTAVVWTVSRTVAFEVEIFDLAECQNAVTKPSVFACALKLCYTRSGDNTPSRVPYDSTQDDAFYVEGPNPKLVPAGSPASSVVNTYTQLTVRGYRLQSTDYVGFYSFVGTCDSVTAYAVTSGLVLAANGGTQDLGFILHHTKDQVGNVCFRWTDGRVVRIGSYLASTSPYAFESEYPADSYTIRQQLKQTLTPKSTTSCPASEPSSTLLQNVHHIWKGYECTPIAGYTLLPQYRTNVTLYASEITSNTIATTSLTTLGYFATCGTVCGRVMILQTLTVSPMSPRSYTITGSPPRAWMVVSMTFIGESGGPLSTTDRVYLVKSTEFVSCPSHTASSNGVHMKPLTAVTGQSNQVQMRLAVENAGEYVVCYIRAGGAPSAMVDKAIFSARIPEFKFFTNAPEIRYDTVVDLLANPTSGGETVTLSASADTLALTSKVFDGNVADCTDLSSLVSLTPLTLQTNGSITHTHTINNILNRFVCYRISSNIAVHIGTIPVVLPRIITCGPAFAVSRQRITLTCESAAGVTLHLSTITTAQDYVAFSRTRTCDSLLLDTIEVETVPALFNYTQTNANTLMLRLTPKDLTLQGQSMAVYVCSRSASTGSLGAVQGSVITVSHYEPVLFTPAQHILAGYPSSYFSISGVSATTPLPLRVAFVPVGTSDGGRLSTCYLPYDASEALVTTPPTTTLKSVIASSGLAGGNEISVAAADTNVTIAGPFPRSGDYRICVYRTAWPDTAAPASWFSMPSLLTIKPTICVEYGNVPRPRVGLLLNFTVRGEGFTRYRMLPASVACGASTSATVSVENTTHKITIVSATELVWEGVIHSANTYQVCVTHLGGVEFAAPMCPGTTGADVPGVLTVGATSPVSFSTSHSPVRQGQSATLTFTFSAALPVTAPGTVRYITVPDTTTTPPMLSCVEPATSSSIINDGVKPTLSFTATPQRHDVRALKQGTYVVCYRYADSLAGFSVVPTLLSIVAPYPSVVTITPTPNANDNSLQATQRISVQYTQSATIDYSSHEMKIVLASSALPPPQGDGYPCYASTTTFQSYNFVVADYTNTISRETTMSICEAQVPVSTLHICYKVASETWAEIGMVKLVQQRPLRLLPQTSPSNPTPSIHEIFYWVFSPQPVSPQQQVSQLKFSLRPRAASADRCPPEWSLPWASVPSCLEFAPEGTGVYMSFQRNGTHTPFALSPEHGGTPVNPDTFSIRDTCNPCYITPWDLIGGTKQIFRFRGNRKANVQLSTATDSVTLTLFSTKCLVRDVVVGPVPITSVDSVTGDATALIQLPTTTTPLRLQAMYNRSGVIVLLPTVLSVKPDRALTTSICPEKPVLGQHLTVVIQADAAFDVVLSSGDKLAFIPSSAESCSMQASVFDLPVTVTSSTLSKWHVTLPIASAAVPAGSYDICYLRTLAGAWSRLRTVSLHPAIPTAVNASNVLRQWRPRQSLALSVPSSSTSNMTRIAVAILNATEAPDKCKDTCSCPGTLCATPPSTVPNTDVTFVRTEIGSNDLLSKLLLTAFNVDAFNTTASSGGVRICTRVEGGTMVLLPDIFTVGLPNPSAYAVTPSQTPMAGELIRISFTGTNLEVNDRIFVSATRTCDQALSTPVVASALVELPDTPPSSQLVYVCYEFALTNQLAVVDPALPMIPASPATFATTPTTAYERQNFTLYFPLHQADQNDAAFLSSTPSCDPAQSQRVVTVTAPSGSFDLRFKSISLMQGTYRVCYIRALGSIRSIGNLVVHPPNPSSVLQGCERVFNGQTAMYTFAGAGLAAQDTVTVLQSNLTLPSSICYSNNLAPPTTTTPTIEIAYNGAPTEVAASGLLSTAQVTVSKKFGPTQTSYVRACYRLSQGGGWSAVPNGTSVATAMTLTTTPTVSRYGVIGIKFTFTGLSLVTGGVPTMAVRDAATCSVSTGVTYVSGNVATVSFSPVAATHIRSPIVCVYLPTCGSVLVDTLTLLDANPSGYRVHMIDASTDPTAAVRAGDYVNISFIGTGLTSADAVVFADTSCDAAPLVQSSGVVVLARNDSDGGVRILARRTGTSHVCYTFQGGLSELMPTLVVRTPRIPFYVTTPASPVRAGNSVQFQMIFDQSNVTHNGTVSFVEVPSSAPLPDGVCDDNKRIEAYAMSAETDVAVSSSSTTGRVDYFRSAASYVLCYITTSTPSRHIFEVNPYGVFFTVSEAAPATVHVCPSPADIAPVRIKQRVEFFYEAATAVLAANAADEVLFIPYYGTGTTCFNYASTLPSTDLAKVIRTNVIAATTQPTLLRKNSTAVLGASNYYPGYFTSAGNYLMCYTRSGSVSSPVAGDNSKAILSVRDAYPATTTVNTCLSPFTPFRISFMDVTNRLAATDRVVFVNASTTRCGDLTINSKTFVNTTISFTNAGRTQGHVDVTLEKAGEYRVCYGNKTEKSVTAGGACPTVPALSTPYYVWSEAASSVTLSDTNCYVGQSTLRYMATSVVEFAGVIPGIRLYEGTTLDCSRPASESVSGVFFKRRSSTSFEVWWSEAAVITDPVSGSNRSFYMCVDVCSSWVPACDCGANACTFQPKTASPASLTVVPATPFAGQYIQAQITTPSTGTLRALRLVRFVNQNRFMRCTQHVIRNATDSLSLATRTISFKHDWKETNGAQFRVCVLLDGDAGFSMVPGVIVVNPFLTFTTLPLANRIYATGSVNITLRAANRPITAAVPRNIKRVVFVEEPSSCPLHALTDPPQGILHPFVVPSMYDVVNDSHPIRIRVTRATLPPQGGIVACAFCAGSWAPIYPDRIQVLPPLHSNGCSWAPDLNYLYPNERIYATFSSPELLAVATIQDEVKLVNTGRPCTDPPARSNLQTPILSKSSSGVMWGIVPGVTGNFTVCYRVRYSTFTEACSVTIKPTPVVFASMPCAFVGQVSTLTVRSVDLPLWRTHGVRWLLDTPTNTASSERRCERHFAEAQDPLDWTLTSSTLPNMLSRDLYQTSRQHIIYNETVFTRPGSYSICLFHLDGSTVTVPHVLTVSQRVPNIIKVFPTRVQLGHAFRLTFLVARHQRWRLYPRQSLSTANIRAAADAVISYQSHGFPWARDLAGVTSYSGSSPYICSDRATNSTLLPFHDVSGNSSNTQLRLPTTRTGTYTICYRYNCSVVVAGSLQVHSPNPARCTPMYTPMLRSGVTFEIEFHRSTTDPGDLYLSGDDEVKFISPTEECLDETPEVPGVLCAKIARMSADRTRLTANIRNPSDLETRQVKICYRLRGSAWSAVPGCGPITLHPPRITSLTYCPTKLRTFTNAAVTILGAQFSDPVSQTASNSSVVFVPTEAGVCFTSPPPSPISYTPSATALSLRQVNATRTDLIVNVMFPNTTTFYAWVKGVDGNWTRVPDVINVIPRTCFSTEGVDMLKGILESEPITLYFGCLGRPFQPALEGVNGSTMYVLNDEHVQCAATSEKQRQNEALYLISRETKTTELGVGYTISLNTEGRYRLCHQLSTTCDVNIVEDEFPILPVRRNPESYVVSVPVVVANQTFEVTLQGYGLDPRRDNLTLFSAAAYPSRSTIESIDRPSEHVDNLWKWKGNTKEGGGPEVTFRGMVAEPGTYWLCYVFVHRLVRCVEPKLTVLKQDFDVVLTPPSPFAYETMLVRSTVLHGGVYFIVPPTATCWQAHSAQILRKSFGATTVTVPGTTRTTTTHKMLIPVSGLYRLCHEGPAFQSSAIVNTTLQNVTVRSGITEMGAASIFPPAPRVGQEITFTFTASGPNVVSSSDDRVWLASPSESCEDVAVRGVTPTSVTGNTARRIFTASPVSTVLTAPASGYAVCYSTQACRHGCAIRVLQFDLAARNPSTARAPFGTVAYRGESLQVLFAGAGLGSSDVATVVPVTSESCESTVVVATNLNYAEGSGNFTVFRTPPMGMPGTYHACYRLGIDAVFTRVADSTSESLVRIENTVLHTASVTSTSSPAGATVRLPISVNALVDFVGRGLNTTGDLIYVVPATSACSTTAATYVGTMTPANAVGQSTGRWSWTPTQPGSYRMCYRTSYDSWLTPSVSGDLSVIVIGMPSYLETTGTRFADDTVPIAVVGNGLSQNDNIWVIAASSTCANTQDTVARLTVNTVSTTRVVATVSGLTMGSYVVCYRVENAIASTTLTPALVIVAALPKLLQVRELPSGASGATLSPLVIVMTSGTGQAVSDTGAQAKLVEFTPTSAAAFGTTEWSLSNDGSRFAWNQLVIAAPGTYTATVNVTLSNGVTLTTTTPSFVVTQGTAMGQPTLLSVLLCDTLRVNARQPVTCAVTYRDSVGITNGSVSMFRYGVAPQNNAIVALVSSNYNGFVFTVTPYADVTVFADLKTTSSVGVAITNSPLAITAIGVPSATRSSVLCRSADATLSVAPSSPLLRAGMEVLCTVTLRAADGAPVYVGNNQTTVVSTPALTFVEKLPSTPMPTSAPLSAVHRRSRAYYYFVAAAADADTSNAEKEEVFRNDTFTFVALAPSDRTLGSLNMTVNLFTGADPRNVSMQLPGTPTRDPLIVVGTATAQATRVVCTGRLTKSTTYFSPGEWVDCVVTSQDAQALVRTPASDFTVTPSFVPEQQQGPIPSSVGTTHTYMFLFGKNATNPISFATTVLRPQQQTTAPLLEIASAFGAITSWVVPSAGPYSSTAFAVTITGTALSPRDSYALVQTGSCDNVAAADKRAVQENQLNADGTTLTLRGLLLPADFYVLCYGYNSMSWRRELSVLEVVASPTQPPTSTPTPPTLPPTNLTDPPTSPPPTSTATPTPSPTDEGDDDRECVDNLCLLHYILIIIGIIIFILILSVIGYHHYQRNKATSAVRLRELETFERYAKGGGVGGVSVLRGARGFVGGPGPAMAASVAVDPETDDAGNNNPQHQRMPGEIHESPERASSGGSHKSKGSGSPGMSIGDVSPPPSAPPPKEVPTIGQTSTTAVSSTITDSTDESDASEDSLTPETSYLTTSVSNTPHVHGGVEPNIDDHGSGLPSPATHASGTMTNVGFSVGSGVGAVPIFRASIPNVSTQSTRIVQGAAAMPTPTVQPVNSHTFKCVMTPSAGTPENASKASTVLPDSTPHAAPTATAVPSMTSATTTSATTSSAPSVPSAAPAAPSISSATTSTTTTTAPTPKPVVAPPAPSVGGTSATTTTTTTTGTGSTTTAKTTQPPAPATPVPA
eukprot:PhM_4_TR14682/c0_g1_i1/m.16564